MTTHIEAAEQAIQTIRATQARDTADMYQPVTGPTAQTEMMIRDMARYVDMVPHGELTAEMRAIRDYSRVASFATAAASQMRRVAAYAVIGGDDKGAYRIEAAKALRAALAIVEGE